MSYELNHTADRLELVLKEGSSKSRIFAEFVKGPLGYRLRKGGGKNQAIARAVGLKTYKGSIQVFDLTAGLGQDAFILASLGCAVHLVERSQTIAALLMDGLRRAKQNKDIAPIIQSMKVTVGESTHFLQALSENEWPDVIYLDPMFPTPTKSALSKIEMRIIRDIVGGDEDAGGLLTLALSKAKKRVVVKRPKDATPLSGLVPSFLVAGKANRYDVYIIGGKNLER